MSDTLAAARRSRRVDAPRTLSDRPVRSPLVSDGSGGLRLADALDDALAHELANQPRALSPDIDRWCRRVASLSRRLRRQRDREGLTAPMRRGGRPVHPPQCAGCSRPLGPGDPVTSPVEGGLWHTPCYEVVR